MRAVGAVLLLALGVAVMSCRTSQSATSASSTASASASATPSASHTAQPGWKTYVSARWGYSIDYPGGWYDIPNHGAPDTQKYFSNEVVGAPLQMSAHGVWETISIGPTASQPCTPSWASVMAIRQSPIRVDGVSTTLYVINFTPPGTEASYQVDVWVSHGGSCYSITFLSQTPSARDAYIEIASQAIASFQFRS